MKMNAASWTIDPAWLPQMNDAKFNGNTFTAILQSAVQRLINAFGTELLNEATALTTANPSTPEYPFNEAHMNNLLRDGEFKYYQIFEPPVQPGIIGIVIPTPQLVIR